MTFFFLEADELVRQRWLGKQAVSKMSVLTKKSIFHGYFIKNPCTRHGESSIFLSHKVKPTVELFLRYSLLQTDKFAPRA